MLKIIKARAKLLEIVIDAMNQGLSWKDIKKILEVKKTLKNIKRRQAEGGDRDSYLVL